MNSSMRRALDQDPRARAAVLAGVAEHRRRRRGRGGLEVGVGEDDVRRLAAELERHPLDRLRGAGGDPAADLGRAGERDLGDVGVLDQAAARRPSPGPATTLSTPSGSPASSAIRSSSSAVSGVSSAGFSTTVLPAASAGATFHEAITSGKFQGDDQPDDAERLAEGHVDAAGDRDRLPEQALRRAGVVAEALDDHPDLAAGVADRLAGVARLERRQLLGRARRARPRAAAAAPPGRPGATARQRREGGLRRGDRGVGLLDARARDLGHHLLGRRLDDLDHAADLHRARRPRPAPRSPRLVASSSACQRTPSAQRALGQLDRLDHARRARPSRCATSPSPSSADALVVVRAHRRPARRRRRAPPASPARAGPRGRRSCPGVCRWTDRRRPGAARACRRGRRSAAACPRQIAEQRQVALERAARRARARSGRARAGCRCVLGSRLGAVGRRVDVGAAGEDQRVEQVEQLVRASRAARLVGGRSSGRPPARRRAARVGALRDVDLDVRPRPSSARARPPRRCRSTGRARRSEPLEAPEALPVGDGGLERRRARSRARFR